MRIMGFVSVAVLAIALSASAAPAQEFALGDPVADHPGVTYFDLVAQFTPGLTVDANGAKAPGGFELRHIDGNEGYDGPPFLASAPVFYQTIVREDFESEGFPKLALFTRMSSAVDFYGDGPAVLAVFTTDPVPQLLDLVDVTMDRDVSLGSQAPVRIGPHDEALIVSSSHFNSQEAYNLQTLIMLRQGKFEPIDTIGTLYVRYCSFSQEQSLRFSADGEPSQNYWPIIATVAQTHRPGEMDCTNDDPKPRDLSVSVTYNWNAASGAYIGDQTPFSALSYQE